MNLSDIVQVLLDKGDILNASKLIDIRIELNNIIGEIYKTAKEYDSGERQYKMTDWDYICKQCEKVINK